MRYIIKKFRTLINLPLKQATIVLLFGGWLGLNGLVMALAATGPMMLLLGLNLWFGIMLWAGCAWLGRTIPLSPRPPEEEQPTLVVTPEHTQVFLDNETGIGDRIYFDQRFEAYLADRESHDGGSVFLIQMQQLDMIQQHNGDAGKQELLGYFSALIIKLLEDYQNAVFARRAESDFALLLPHVDIEEAEKVASQLIRVCNRISLPETVDSEHFFHIGIAHFGQNNSSYKVLAEADMALRAAQLQGPSNWFMYDRGVIDKDLAKGAQQWQQTIDTAIKQRAFVLLFQPVTLSDSNIIHHHEILARMRDDNGQLINASVFLPMARKFDMIQRIDRLMVEKAVKLLDYEKTGQDLCSLNLHLDSLLDQEFQQWLLIFLQEHTNAARRMIIEVGEYPIITQGKTIKRFFHALHKAGVRLLVDHVGLYVLNTQYIREFEIDYLKLHISVVRNVHAKAENQLFIKGLQEACKGTHVLIFGLGVEHVEEWIALQKLGVAGAQGYYFTEPLESIHQISPSH